MALPADDRGGRIGLVAGEQSIEVVGEFCLWERRHPRRHACLQSFRVQRTLTLTTLYGEEVQYFGLTECHKEQYPMLAAKLLKQLLKLFSTQVTITKNLGEQPGPNCFARVNRHYCRTTIFVMNKMMATFNAEHYKTSLLQDR